MDEQHVDIVVTTRDNAGVLRETLRSVAEQSYRNYQCYVIDDASTDDTVPMVHREFAWVRVLEVQTPSGPARNRNVAVASGSAPLVATLDDDVVLTPEWLEEMVRFASESPNIGAVGSQLRFVSPPNVLNSIGGYFTDDGLGADLYFNVPLSGMENLIRHPLRIVYACSAAMLMRREAFENAGGFDADYFYMAEDFDLGLRMNLCGYSIVYNPRAVAYHRYHTRANRLSRVHVHYLYYRNSLRTVLKNFPLSISVRIAQTIRYRLFRFLRSKDHWPHAYAILKALAWNLAHLASARRAYAAVQTCRAVENDVILIVNSRLLELRTSGTRSDSRRSPIARLTGRLLRSALHSLSSSRAQPRNPGPGHRPHYVDNIIFQITNICNAACKQCFVLDQLNRDVHKNLSLEEIERFFTSLGRIGNVVLGGGEPFLRKDLDRLCILLSRISQPDCITIPTNGAYPDIVSRQVKKILETTRSRLKISLSVDGPPEIHNAIRKVADLYDKVRETYDRLAWLYEIFYPRLMLQVNSTVFRDNYDQFVDTYRLVREHFPLAEFAFETIRGHYEEGSAEPITDAEYADLIGAMRSIGDPSMTHTLTLHELALETIRRRTQVVPCNGGMNFLVLDFFGNLFPCEILPVHVNIRDIGYDFARVAHTPEWRRVIEDIQNAKCHCTHMCFLASSLQEARRGGPCPSARRRSDQINRQVHRCWNVEFDGKEEVQEPGTGLGGPV